MAYSLPELPYALDALEPAIDAKTMEIHSQKHHAAYVAKANAALEGIEHSECIYTQIQKLDELPADKIGPVRNNGGGHANHSMFWAIMTPGGSPLEGDLKAAIDSDLGGFDAFKEAFANAAATRFGSGWAWLCVGDDGKLFVTSTPNQDNPVMGSKYVDQPGKPILGLDVWEHAYYLNYQNRRPDYISAFFSVINWAKVGEYYAMATGQCEEGCGCSK